MRRWQRWRYRRGIASALVRREAVGEYWLWRVVCACDIPIDAQIAGGLVLPHPVGVVLHPGARIGPNCCLFQETLIVEGVDLGAGVEIGAGAKVIRPVRIGENALIGASAVVLADVPPNTTVVGVWKGERDDFPGPAESANGKSAANALAADLVAAVRDLLRALPADTERVDVPAKLQPLWDTLVRLRQRAQRAVPASQSAD